MAESRIELKEWMPDQPGLSGALTTSKTIDTGDVFKIASGSLTVTLA